MKKRQYLEGSILLCGESDGAVFKRTFIIDNKLKKEGASSVCYEAHHGNSGIGILKEFYPKDTYVLERTENGQLIHSPECQEAYERFLKSEKEYIEPYEKLMKAKLDNKELSAFIPAFEIYHGCDENKNIIGTTYIWTPKPELETFDKICDEIHRNPEESPEHNMVKVLTMIKMLTKCVCAMHSADMVHRDINPFNFGFDKLQNDTLPETLAMFDINSICSVYEKSNCKVGTDGYIEPEAGYEAANNQTDIYSIGATLFHAVIVTDEAEAGGYLYKREYQDRIQEMVNESRLIQASEANSHPMLRNTLAEILTKCLRERSSRYANCEELLEDLETARFYALPSEIAKNSPNGEKWVLTGAEKFLDVNKEKNSFQAIQYHLYEHPLYQCIPDGEEINVLIIGFGNYGQKFLDACLQNGQMRGRKLQVTVLTDNSKFKDIYRSDRPELADFFNIDGALKECGDTYGDITFEIKKLNPKNRDANAGILQDIMCEHYDSRQPHYIFIALGEDSLNRSAADACRTAAEILEMECVVSYVCENGNPSDENCPMLYPLYVNQAIQKSKIYQDIERMAFNAHLVWEKNINIDYTTVWADFKKTYNHDSCISNVLSLKYKLYSIGIDLDRISFDEAARRFTAIFNRDPKSLNRELRNELIWIEHRRWVTEKLCLGWKRFEKLEDCAGGMTKDAKTKRHICIAKSRPDQKLSEQYWKNDNCSRWDNASENDLNQLDDLDRMSVELHRMFAEKAASAKNQNLLSGNSTAEIRSLIEDSRKAVAAFQEWFTCMKDIWNGEAGKFHLYKGLKASFLRAADELPDDQKKSVREQVRAFESTFYPVLASMEYRNWKQDDVEFIDSIPFILTYMKDTYMVIPFATGDNTKVFGNVAAPAAAGPKKIIYLYLIENKQDITDLRESIPYAAEYMRKKNFRASAEFILIYDKEKITFVNQKKITEEIKSLGRDKIRELKCIAQNGMDAVLKNLKEYLQHRSDGKQLFALEINETKLSGMLQGAGFYSSFPSYQFDSCSMKFKNTAHCDMFGYIRKTPYFTVADMLAFSRSSSESSSHPEFFGDYRDLWKKYRENSGVWKMLCDTLGEHAVKNDSLVSFAKKELREKNKEPQKYRYILPFVCIKSANKIIQFLISKRVLEPESRVNGYTTDSCEVEIADRYGCRAKYDSLFSNVYALMLPDAVTPHLNPNSHEIRVMFDSLSVNGVQIPFQRRTELNSLMNYFREKGYVINLKTTGDGKMSFTYATRQIKELLTTAGKMLEVYTYHKVKESGKFDDVVSGYEVNWENSDVKSEFDCILTKGFRSLFVECKARSVIDQNFYHKLKDLAEKFGINATAVLIADTREKDFYDSAAVNDMQRERGRMLNVVTIWDSAEIGDIGYTLLRIINGTYAAGNKAAGKSDVKEK